MIKDSQKNTLLSIRINNLFVFFPSEPERSRSGAEAGVQRERSRSGKSVGRSGAGAELEQSWNRPGTGLPVCRSGPVRLDLTTGPVRTGFIPVKL